MQTSKNDDHTGNGSTEARKLRHRRRQRKPNRRKGEKDSKEAGSADRIKSEAGQFELELDEALLKVDGLFGADVGDRLVAISLLNPSLEIDEQPSRIASYLEKSALAPTQLWTLFVAHGGTASEDPPFEEEADQIDSLRGVWEALRKVEVE